MAKFSLMNIARNLPMKKKGALDLYGTGEVDPQFRAEPAPAAAKYKPGPAGKLDLYGTGQIDPNFVAETSGKEAKKPGKDWSGILGAGLMGAAGAIQANVGPAKPGASLAQGLLKGIVGTGLVRSALAQQEAEAAEKGRGLQEKKELIDYAAKGKPTAAEKIAFEVQKQKALEPGLVRIAEAGTRIKTDAQRKIEAAQKGMSEAEIARINQQVGEQTDAYFANKNKGKFNPPPVTAQEWNDKNEELKLNAFGGRPKPLKRPVLPD